MNFLVLWIVLNAVVLGLAYPLSAFAYHVLQQKSLGPIEQRLFGTLSLASGPMSWREYLLALLKFQFWGWLLIYLLARFQSGSHHYLPDASFELASSFVTNTNWLSFSGEQYWQLPLWLLGVMAQNFFSAATGICVLLVFSRCFKGKDANLGNFGLDMWRSNVYVLLPIALIAALFLVWQGSPQNFASNLVISQYDNSQSLTQLLPMGPIASQESIKLIGTNGGGYTFSNSGHPFENPTFLTHCLGMVLMLLLPAMGCFLFARINQQLSYGFYIWLVIFTGKPICRLCLSH